MGVRLLGGLDGCGGPCEGFCALARGSLQSPASLPHPRCSQAPSHPRSARMPPLPAPHPSLASAAGAYANASRRVRRLAARGLLKRAALKPGAIIMPRDTWPRFDGGICMEAQGATRDGKLQFGYVYSQAYQARASLPWCRGAGAAWGARRPRRLQGWAAGWGAAVRRARRPLSKPHGQRETAAPPRLLLAC